MTAMLSALLPGTETLAAWLLTYLLHSSLLLAAVTLADRALTRRASAIREPLWKIALVGGLVTASIQVGLGYRPFSGSLSLARPVAAPAPVVVTAPPAPRTTSLDRRASAAAPVAGTAGVRDAAFRAPVPAATAATAPDRTAGLSWAGALALVWLLGGLGGALLLGLSYATFHRRLRGRAEIEGGTMETLFRGLLERSRLRRRVRLTCSTRVPAPLARGVLDAEVCVPVRAVAELDTAQQEALLAHELGHIARRDPAWLLVGRLFERVLFLQPLNRLARQRLQEIAEFRADDWAVAATGKPLDLARCLTRVAGWNLPGLPAPAIARGHSGLGRRVHRLLAPQPEAGSATPRSLAWLAAAAILAVAIAAPGFSAAPPADPAPPAPPPVPAPAPAPTPVIPPVPPTPVVAPAPMAVPAPVAVPAPPAPPHGLVRLALAALAPLTGEPQAPPAEHEPNPDPDVEVETEVDVEVEAFEEEIEAVLAPLEEWSERLEVALAPLEDLGDELDDLFDGFEDELDALTDGLEDHLELSIELRFEELSERQATGRLTPTEERELEQLHRRLAEHGERMAELSRVLTERMAPYHEQLSARIHQQIQPLVERLMPDPAAIHELAETARRMAAAGQLSAEQREALRVRAREIAERHRPSPEELEKLREAARRAAEEARPTAQERERLRAEMRAEMDRLRAELDRQRMELDRGRQEQELRRQELEKQRQELQRERERLERERPPARG